MSKRRNDDNEGSNVVTMTQESLDGLFAARATRAAEVKQNEILEKLGFKTVDAVLEELETLRNQVTEVNDGHQETVDGLNAQLSEANESLTTLQESLKTNAVKKEIAEHFNEFGFVDASKSDVYAIFEGELPEGVEVNEETLEVTGVKKALEVLAENKPHWTVPQNVRTRTPGRRTQSPPPATPGGEEDAEIYRIKM